MSGNGETSATPGLGPAEVGEGVRILVVDDHPIVRAAITQLVAGKPGMQVCGEAGDAASAMEAVERLGPGMAIVDISLNGTNGLELIKDLNARWPTLRILVLSVHDELQYAERSLHAGALGYISKQARPEAIEQAISRVAQGQAFLSEAAAARVINRVAGVGLGDRASVLDALSDRETEVFELMGRGFGTREIADRLHLSVKTVASHRENLKRKLKVKTIQELLRFAIAYAGDHARNPPVDPGMRSVG